MASKIELVKSDLAFHGIRAMEDGRCFSFMEGQEKPVQSSCRDKIYHLKYEIDSDKNGLRSFWVKAIKLLQSPQQAMAGGSPTTEKMFAATLKHLLRFSRRYQHFRKDTPIILAALRKDVKRFNETTMSKVVDYKICIEWIDHLVKQGLYCVKLLSFFEKHRTMSAVASEKKVPVIAQQLVPSGTMDMEGDEHDPLKERRWEWDDEDFKEDMRPPNMEQYVGNDPEWREEGWNFYDPTQGTESLYTLGDENDPYKGKIKPTSYRGPV